MRDIGFLAVERIDESRRLQLLLLGKLPRSQTLHLLVDQFLDRIRLVEDHRLRHTLRENLLDALDMNLLLLPELAREGTPRPGTGRRGSLEKGGRAEAAQGRPCRSRPQDPALPQISGCAGKKHRRSDRSRALPTGNARRTG